MLVGSEPDGYVGGSNAAIVRAMGSDGQATIEASVPGALAALAAASTARLTSGMTA